MTGSVLLGMLAAIVAVWALAALASVRALAGGPPIYDRLGRGGALAGVAALAATIAALWLTLDRPPLRTLGETRLWYALWLVGLGCLLEWRLRTRALRLPMLAMGALFLGLDLWSPAALDRTLMPALASPWFVPHVTVYLAAYAVLGLSCGAALTALWRRRGQPLRDEDLRLPLLLVHLGLPLLTCGLCFGALWAKEAWGHWWAWDPKETWALLAWIGYVVVIHHVRRPAARPRGTLLLIAGAFAVLLGCWYLVNLLPSAQVSVHTYAVEP